MLCDIYNSLTVDIWGAWGLILEFLKLVMVKNEDRKRNLGLSYL